MPLISGILDKETLNKIKIIEKNNNRIRKIN